MGIPDARPRMRAWGHLVLPTEPFRPIFESHYAGRRTTDCRLPVQRVGFRERISLRRSYGRGPHASFA